MKDRKQEFLQDERRYKGPNRVVIFMFFLVAVVGLTWFMMANQQTVAIVKRYEGGNYNIGKSVKYKGGQYIDMVDFPYVVQDGKMVFPVDKVIEAKLVNMDTGYVAAGLKKAITAYIAPSGRLVVALAICEPCRSTNFYIDGYVLVCKVCGSRWLLNDLQGVSGGCLAYPPEELPYEVKDGMIYVPDKIIQDWAPRV